MSNDSLQVKNLCERTLNITGLFAEVTALRAPPRQLLFFALAGFPEPLMGLERECQQAVALQHTSDLMEDRPKLGQIDHCVSSENKIGAGVGSVVKGHTTIESLASNRSSWTMTAGRGLPT